MSIEKYRNIDKVWISNESEYVQMQNKIELELPKKWKKIGKDEMEKIEGGKSGSIKAIGDWLRNIFKK